MLESPNFFHPVKKDFYKSVNFLGGLLYSERMFLVRAIQEHPTF